MPQKSEFPTYFSFRHPLVRDLCWTLSPAFDLLGHLPPFHRFVPRQSTAQLRNWLEQLEQTPAPLEAFMADNPRKRLGHHFERLVLFYLSHAPNSTLRVLDHNRAIYGNNASGHRITIGELDFLLAQDNRLLHLETAVKFFLGVAHEGRVRWLGPGLKDRFDRKIDHLRNHQLPLSQQIEAETGPIERWFWLKGILFHPWQQLCALDVNLLDSPVQHYWLTRSQALEMADLEEWCCLSKLQWLGCGGESMATLSSVGEAIKRHFAQNDRVLMLSHSSSSARRLLVPDAWPRAARAALAERSTPAPT